MTLLNDEEIASSIVVSGTIVPFLVTKKEPDEYIRDFSILVKKKNIDSIRKKVKNLSKEDLNIEESIGNFDLSDFIDEIEEFYTDLAEIKEREFEVIRPNTTIQVTWDYNKIKRI